MPLPNLPPGAETGGVLALATMSLAHTNTSDDYEPFSSAAVLMTAQINYSAVWSEPIETPLS